MGHEDVGFRLETGHYSHFLRQEMVGLKLRH